MADLGKAYVQIVPSAKGLAGSIGEVINKDASTAGKKAGETLGKGIATKLKTAVAVLGIGKMITDSFKAGADLEQSIGGVETLFKNSADKIKKYATDAYKTAGVSANDYMQNITSFSASLLQSTAGDTNKAAEIAHMAMVDMSDNANKMGSDMVSIQTAYQGFAKQNYTMLDNLKLGYGGTKTEMERLLADAQKLTGVEYNIDNLSDVYEAIHVIQGELGITGTTALEATETFSGSLNMLKASFQNVLASLSTGSDTLTQDVSNMFKSVYSFGKNLLRFSLNLGKSLGKLIGQGIVEGIPFIIGELSKLSGSLNANVGNILNELKEFIKLNLLENFKLGEMLPDLLTSLNDIIMNVKEAFIQLLPQIFEIGGMLLQFIVQSFLEYFPLILEGAVNIVIGLVDGIIKSIPLLVEGVYNLINTFVSTIFEHGPQYIESGLNIIMMLISGISTAVPNLIGTLAETILQLVMKLKDDLPQFLEKGTELIQKLADGIVQRTPEVISKIKELLFKTLDKIKENFPAILTHGWELIINLASGIVKAVPKIIVSILKIMGAITVELWKALPQLLAKGLEFMVNFSIGLVRGIPTVISKIPGFITQLLNSFGELLTGIKDVGGNMIRGLWNGIQDVKGWIIDKIKSLGNEVIGAIKGIFGIHSPSTVMRDEVGKYVSLGFAEGIMDNLNPVENAMNEMENLALRDMQSSIAYDVNGSSSLDSGFSNSINLTASLRLGNENYKVFVENLTREQERQAGLSAAF